MGAAASYTVSGVVGGSDAYDRNIFIKSKLLTQRHFLRVFPIIETEYRYGRVGPDDFVCQTLAVKRRLPIDDVRLRPLGIRRFVFETDVDGHVIITHVEAAVHAAAFLIEDPGENMLAAVTLHVVETTRPVQTAADAAAFGQTFIRGKPVHYIVPVLLHVRHLQNRSADAVIANDLYRSQVATLAAALGEEGCPVKIKPMIRDIGDHCVPFFHINIALI